MWLYVVYVCVYVLDVPVCGMSGRELSNVDVKVCLKEVHVLVLNKEFVTTYTVQK
jgi:hypothetical protein